MHILIAVRRGCGKDGKWRRRLDFSLCSYYAPVFVRTITSIRESGHDRDEGRGRPKYAPLCVVAKEHAGSQNQLIYVVVKTQSDPETRTHIDTVGPIAHFCTQKDRHQIWPRLTYSLAMPRENRKRGKKHKKQKDNEQVARAEPVQVREEAAERAGPSWIIERTALGSEEDGSLDAPFGYVDPDVKAYFKTVDDRLREWQETKEVPAEVDEGDVDPNEGPSRKPFYFKLSSINEHIREKIVPCCCASRTVW